MDPRVFISYRRGSTNFPAAILHHALTARLGAGNVFLDRESIPHGANFMERIGDAIRQCTCVIALIGHDWASRLGAPDDFVRQELEIALDANVPILPVFVDGIQTVPREIPESVSRLKSLSGTVLRASISEQAIDIDSIHQAVVCFAEARLRQTPAPTRKDSFDRNSQLAASELFWKGVQLQNDGEFDEAIRYLELAAQKGSADACYELTEIYSNGKIRNQDMKQMARWSLRGAELGHAELMGLTGMCYAMGMGTDLDFEKAKHWLRLGVSKGDKNSREMLEAVQSPLWRFQWKMWSKLKFTTLLESGLKATLRERP